MTEREIVYLNSDGTVGNVAVLGDADPDDLLAAYGYAEWVDRASTPGASIGWRRVGNEWRPPQPFPSWSWSGGAWHPPVPMPDEPGSWSWDEERGEWIDLTADTE